MAGVFENVIVNKILENGTTVCHLRGKAQLRLSYDPAGISVKVVQGKDVDISWVSEFPVSTNIQSGSAIKLTTF